MSYPYPVSVIPGPNDAFSLSQGQIQTNFANLIGWSGVDHYAYGDTNAGTHEQVTFSNVTTQSTPSDPASILYTKNDAQSHPQLFFLNSLNNGFYVPTATGSTVLMGGIILQWGTGSTNGGPNPFNFAAPFTTSCFAVIAQAINGTGPTIANDYVYVSNVTVSGFRATGVRRVDLLATPVNFYYLAVGL